MTLKEAKDYLHFVDNVVGELILNRQCCLDFHNALVAQKANNNIFITWALGNYHKVLILNLCKILEPAIYDKRKRTLRYFINWCRDNYSLLEETMQKATITMTDVTTGAKSELPIGDEMMAALKSINFDSDLLKIEEFHQKLKAYRDKQLAHNYETDEKVIMPEIQDMHRFIDDIEEMMITYHHLFREGLDNSGLKHPYKYGKFTLFLE